jgi:N-acetylmuramoyl-L-alanine amidase
MAIILLPGAVLASSAGDKAVSNPTSQAEQKYKAAKDVYYKLERTTDAKRPQWLKGILHFRRIYLANPQNSLAPSCLFMIGRMYRRMFQQFHIPLDIEEAISSFQNVALLFPGSNLADDALFTIAEINLAEKKQADEASRFYQQVIADYPNGDKRHEAYSRLKHLAQTNKITMPEETVKEQIGRDLVNLQPVQHWSSEEYTRLVIRAAEPVHYSTRLLEKTNQLPRQLLIDFDQSYIPPEAREPLPIEDGLLQKVQASQLNETTVRLALDIESISDYKIFSLKDPFRVIIDVRGEKKEGRKTAVVQPKVSRPSPPVKEEIPAVVVVPQPPQAPAEQTEEVITLQDRKKVKPGAQTTPSYEQIAANAPSLAQQLGLGIRRIVIDPGHGGKDPGAVANHLQEKDIVLSVARRTAKILQKKYNFEVLLTRERDIFIPLEERTAIANTKNADLFVSIHVNAHPKKSAKGVETFYLNLATNTEAMRVAARENATSTHNISELQDILSDLMHNAKIKESSLLAESVQKNLVSGLNQHHYSTRDLGVKQAPFYVLIGAEMPAVLAEISFITNPEEAGRLKDVNYLQSIALQIAAGIADYSRQRRTAAL